MNPKQEKIHKVKSTTKTDKTTTRHRTNTNRCKMTTKEIENNLMGHRNYKKTQKLYKI